MNAFGQDERGGYTENQSPTDWKSKEAPSKNTAGECKSEIIAYDPTSGKIIQREAFLYQNPLW